MTRKQVTFLGEGGSTDRSAIKKVEESEADPKELDWVLKIKEAERGSANLENVAQRNITQFNFGVMQDFFAYSATCV